MYPYDAHVSNFSFFGVVVLCNQVNNVEVLLVWAEGCGGGGHVMMHTFIPENVFMISTAILLSSPSVGLSRNSLVSQFIGV